jgi:hypothetical protein
VDKLEASTKTSTQADNCLEIHLHVYYVGMHIEAWFNGSEKVVRSSTEKP